MNQLNHKYACVVKWFLDKILKSPHFVLLNVDSSHKTFSFQYEFNWEVKDREAKADGAFFTHNEKKEEANPDRTEGEYRVWLPDGR